MNLVESLVRLTAHQSWVDRGRMVSEFEILDPRVLRPAAENRWRIEHSARGSPVTNVEPRSSEPPSCKALLEYAECHRFLSTDTSSFL